MQLAPCITRERHNHRIRSHGSLLEKAAGLVILDHVVQVGTQQTSPRNPSLRE